MTPYEILLKQRRLAERRARGRRRLPWPVSITLLAAVLLLGGLLTWRSHSTSAPPFVPQHPRSAWAAPNADIGAMAPMTQITRITIHHEGSEPVDFVDAARTAKRIETIRRYHRTQRGWADIGYHYIIDRGGAVWEARDLDKRGAHAGSPETNAGNLGVMILGNYDRQELTEQQVERLEELLDGWLTAYHLGIDAVHLHSDFKQTDCPGEAIRRWFARWRERKLGT
ncbi:MAG: N-acetylmuramoyl-L-alanine amidase [Planctomycetes bacterium]|nr:N-acetylmuramoyl-L-alanine amidase [Planctomycetota bacterium]